ncbi:MAG: hypothetical protein ACI9KE_005982, partial [Polyangiales bacterium]
MSASKSIRTVECEYASRARGKTAPVLLDPLDNIRPPLCAHPAAA